MSPACFTETPGIALETKERTWVGSILGNGYPTSVIRINPVAFLDSMRKMNNGFVGDSLNENFLVSFLCILRVADIGAKKWKRKGAWRGSYFPKFNVTVGYHRAVLLAKYEWQPKQLGDSNQDGLKGRYRVDVDIPADDWAHIGAFCDVLVFNTGHCREEIELPMEDELCRSAEKELPEKTLKFWRLQSPRHFHGGEWNQNGSCTADELLDELQLDLWFDPRYNGVNKEARRLNHLIEEVLKGTNIRSLDLTHLSEFRTDAHPAIWLGKKDAVAVWGQDCMHWCLPGVPDTRVDILAQLITHYILETG
ncbi:hypothetical protein RND71_000405 [Anisodus tanguticus]|uniref:Trichome birefringence-like C-terminal domain-containing protein n=1 Tax=Anisodus tanguticus TaxID=243964 RepID=A0AAE1SZI4_9SOLA|nr:hypothetical protein RND71_000405 [Anisodus tanguticus]